MRQLCASRYAPPSRDVVVDTGYAIIRRSAALLRRCQRVMFAITVFTMTRAAVVRQFRHVATMFTIFSSLPLMLMRDEIDRLLNIRPYTRVTRAISTVDTPWRCLMIEREAAASYAFELWFFLRDIVYALCCLLCHMPPATTPITAMRAATAPPFAATRLHSGVLALC